MFPIIFNKFSYNFTNLKYVLLNKIWYCYIENQTAEGKIGQDHCNISKTYIIQS